MSPHLLHILLGYVFECLTLGESGAFLLFMLHWYQYCWMLVDKGVSFVEKSLCGTTLLGGSLVERILQVMERANAPLASSAFKPNSFSA
jgi:hypothetical protein